MLRYNESVPQVITFTVEEFGDKLEEAVGKQIMLLIKANNICHIYEEETGIVVIEYASNYEDSTEPVSAWLSEGETKAVKDYDLEKELERLEKEKTQSEPYNDEIEYEYLNNNEQK